MPILSLIREYIFEKEVIVVEDVSRSGKSNGYG